MGVGWDPWLDQMEMIGHPTQEFGDGTGCSRHRERRCVERRLFGLRVVDPW